MHWFSNKTCDLSVMKSCVFSLFTFQMASQFPKRDNHSAEHVWFFVFYFRSFVITMNHQHILTASSRMLYHGSWVIWVMGQVFSGSHGSWVTRSDPSPTLVSSTSVRNSHATPHSISPYTCKQVGLQLIQLMPAALYCQQSFTVCCVTFNVATL